jgi:hypothetical protein
MHFEQYSSTPSKVPPHPGQRGGAMMLNSDRHLPQNRFFPSPSSTPQDKHGKGQTSSTPELKFSNILALVFNFRL